MCAHINRTQLIIVSSLWGKKFLERKSQLSSQLRRTSLGYLTIGVGPTTGTKACLIGDAVHVKSNKNE